jgi:chitodextrinase
VTAGQAATFTVTAAGTAPLSYQWQKNAVNISGATSSSYTTSATTTADNGSTFLVVVANSAGTKTSNAATLTISADTTAPSVPTGLAATGVSSTQISLAWNASTDNVGVTGYNIYRGGTKINTTGSTSFTDSGLAPSTSYSYTVSAYDAAGNTSAQSASASATTQAPPPPGSTITTFGLTSPLTGSLPFTVGLGFKKGDVPSGASLNLTSYQVITKSTWSDGSVKTAIASGLAPLTANTPLTVSVISAAPPTGTNLTCADIQNAAPSASVQLGSIGTVNLSSLLTAPFRTWVSGPQMVECHYRGAVGSDPTLTAWFYVRLWKGGQLWVRAVVENGYVDVATGDKSYVPTVIIGGTTIYNNGGASLSHYANTRWTVESWVGANPQVTPRHDTRYLEASRLVPNYLNLPPSTSVLNNLFQAYTPMAQGDLTTNMEDPGFQYDIGLLPRWDALYITSNGDPRAYAAVLANAKALNSYPIVWNDSATHLPTLPANKPTYTVFGPGGGGANSWASNGGLSWGLAHEPSEGYVAYLITGDYFYLETMEDNATMVYLMNSSSQGSGNNRIFGSQTRSVAWGFRTVGQLAGIGPSGDTQIAGYQAWLGNNVAAFSGTAQTPGMNQLGYPYSYEHDTNAYGTGTGVVAPWQQHFWTQSVGMISDLEPVTNMTSLNALRAYLDLAPVYVLGPPNTPGAYSFVNGGAYNLQVSNLPSDPPTNWYTPGVVQTTNWGANGPGTTLLGNSGEDPANACIGIWGNLLPAIAYAVDHGSAGAAAAWARLQTATNFNSMINNCTASVPADTGGFNDTPIWGIVPRTGSAPPPPPPPATVSVTAPAAGATIAGSVAVTASASSSAGIKGVQFQLDNANLGAQVTTAPYSTSWNTTATTDGTHFLVAVAQDSQGNLTASSSVNVTVSNVAGGTPPVISVVTAVPSASGATVTWTTDKPATSQVEYGATVAYGSQSALDSSLVTLHSVTLSGLSASTTYQFRVHSTDAGGNAAVSGNFNFTTLAQSGGGIPATLGWYQVPNTKMGPVCSQQPGVVNSGGGCVNVIAAWGGGAADTQRNRMYIWGGGHVDYAGNEVYALDLNALAMTRLIDATPNPGMCVEVESDGRPSSRHTYDDLAYIPTLPSNGDKMFSWSGAPWCSNGIGSNATFMLDIPSLTWTNYTGTVTGGSPNGTGGLAEVAYDPNTQLVWIGDTGSIYTYNPQTNAYAVKNNGSAATDYHMSGVIDPVHKLFILAGGGGNPGGGMRVVDISAGSNYALQDWSSLISGCGALTGANYPGLAYDSKQGKIVGWVGGDSVVVFDASAKTCTTVTYSGGPGAAQSAGTSGRFAYFPALNVFAVVNDWQENAYTLRLTP